MSDTANRIVQKLWSYCNVLRDDGLSYQDYLEQLTFLLFLKMADERERLTGEGQPIPAGYRWENLASPTMEGAELDQHYRETLRVLGTRGGMLGLIFEKAQEPDPDGPDRHAVLGSARAATPVALVGTRYRSPAAFRGAGRWLAATSAVTRGRSVLAWERTRWSRATHRVAIQSLFASGSMRRSCRLSRFPSVEGRDGCLHASESSRRRMRRCTGRGRFLPSPFPGFPYRPRRSDGVSRGWLGVSPTSILLQPRSGLTPTRWERSNLMHSPKCPARLSFQMTKTLYMAP